MYMLVFIALRSLKRTIIKILKFGIRHVSIRAAGNTHIYEDKDKPRAVLLCANVCIMFAYIVWLYGFNTLTDPTISMRDPKWHLSHMRGLFSSLTSFMRCNFEAKASPMLLSWFLDKSNNCVRERIKNNNEKKNSVSLELVWRDVNLCLRVKQMILMLRWKRRWSMTKWKD